MTQQDYRRVKMIPIALSMRYAAVIANLLECAACETVSVYSVSYSYLFLLHRESSRVTMEILSILHSCTRSQVQEKDI